MSITTIPRPAPPPAPAPARSTPPDGDERTLATLRTARHVLERGWLQDGWYRTTPRPLRHRLFGPTPGPEGIEAACLVGAVAVAGHAGGAFTHVDRDSGPAMDRLWEALQDTDGRRAGVPRGAVAPIVRRARMRELVRWNDAPGRAREEVLALVDRAIRPGPTDRPPGR